MPTPENEETVQGSWVPIIIVLVILTIRWLLTSQGNVAVSIRRMMQMQVCQRPCLTMQLVVTSICCDTAINEARNSVSPICKKMKVEYL
jgi:hypothetical protein